MKSDIEEKIEKLLSLSNSDNTNEAQAALLKAQELMLKYNITIGYEKNDDAVCTKKIHYKRISIFFESRLAIIIADNFRTKTWGIAGGQAFMGYRADTVASVHCFEFLIDDYKKKFEKYFRDSNASVSGENIFRAKREARKQWQEGYIKGIEDAFKNRKNNPEYELMLVTPYAVMREYEKLNLNSYNMPVNDVTDESAYSAGYVDGKTAMDQRSIQQN